MKTITFFNEKGGVGKSTMTIMYASYLHKHGVKAAVFDYNSRLQDYRNDEIQEKKRLGLWRPEMADSAWPIIGVDRAAVRRLSEKGNPGHLVWFLEKVRNEHSDTDVILIDFPGAISGGEFLEMSNMIGDLNVISLVVIPTDNDPQTLKSTLATAKLSAKVRRIRTVAFINQIKTLTPKRKYDGMKNIFQEWGLPVLPDMVSESERIRNIMNVDIIRSTFGYPDWSLDCFKGSRDLGIDNLLLDVTRELRKAPDVKFVPVKKEDPLSFVDDLRKDNSLQSLNRQLTNTRFPEYELPLPEDMAIKYKWR